VGAYYYVPSFLYLA